MQHPNQPSYRWFWKKGDHWYVVFWTLFSVFGAGQTVAQLTGKRCGSAEPLWTFDDLVRQGLE
jgi:hypothetical protein